MKLQIVDNIADIERRWSVRLAKVGAAIMAGWGALTGLGLVSAVPEWVPQVVAGVILVTIAGAAYLKQPEKRDDNGPDHG